MRKKLFAIVMSMTMVASFMPSLAFAAAHSHSYPIVGTGNGPVTWEQVKAAKNTSEGVLVDVVKEPTCDTNGEAVLTCKGGEACDPAFVGNTKTVVISADHDVEATKMSAKEVADKLLAQDAWTKVEADAFVKAAPTANSGESYCYYEANLCTRCNKLVLIGGKYYTEKDHNRDTSSGCNTKAKCLDCGELVAVKGSVTGTHKPSTTNWVQVTAPTCTTAGEKAPVCETCGEPVLADKVTDTNAPALGHDISKAEVPASEALKSDGVTLKNGYFKVTGYVLDSFGNKGPKYYKASAVVASNNDATATNCPSQKMGVQCANCEQFVVFDANHTTAKASMTTVKAASVDANSAYNVAGALHNFKVVKEVAATCQADAYEVKQCQACEKTVDVPKTGTQLKHSYKVTENKGDCAHDASVVISCENKGCTATKETITKTTTLSESAMYTKSGDTWYFKGFDGELTSFIALPEVNKTAGDHDFGALSLYKDADCTHGEIWARKCKVCGKLDPTSLTNKGTGLGHKLEKVVVSPTCGNEGYTVEQCSVCELCKAKNGTVTVKADDADVWKTDVVKPLVKDGADHAGEAWKVTKVATVFEEGVKTLVCSTCGEELDAKTVIAKKTVAKASNTVTAGKKKLTVKSSAANATGYRVYYKKAGAKSWKSYTKKTASLSKTFSGLSKGKYYVKVRAYAKNYAGEGQVVWGATSSTKSVKVK